MSWHRTLRIDRTADPAIVVKTLAAIPGVRVRAGHGVAELPRYALAEGADHLSPAEVAARTPDAYWFDEAVIALAIEPIPADALPFCARALGGPGAPAAAIRCDLREPFLLVEWAASRAPVSLLRALLAVELRRFGGAAPARLLAPLADPVAAAIAADGLRAPEIGEGRILERLLEHAGVV